MITVYYIAAFLGGFMFPEFIMMLSRRPVSCELPMNFCCGFIAMVILHAHLN